MTAQKTLRRRGFLLGTLAAAQAAAHQAESVPARHPRVLITPEMVREMAEKVQGPFAEEYSILLRTAALGPRFLEQQYAVPGAFMEAGLAYLIERELGRDGQPYAERVLEIWRRPEWQVAGLRRHFGWQGLLYDWLHDAMTPEERRQFGELLGEWVATWWRSATVIISRPGWWYNQHWGPEHLDVPHNRQALTSKLFMSLATAGNAGRFEEAVQTNLRSFREKFEADGLPALEEMGGVWAESNGHGYYGPVLVVPLTWQAALTGLGIDAFAAGGARGFSREYIRAGVYSLMPHNDKLAYIDDSSSGYPVQHARCAPLFARHYRDGVARWLSDTALNRAWLTNSNLRQPEVWQRIAFLPADLGATSPGEAGWPLAACFRGAGHVYMRSAWDDPEATWAFFGAGPSYAAHSRDDEGHFLICRKGHLVNRSGGGGGNDNAYYTGGSLAFNIVTIYHPEEKMRRDSYNENDGGLLRYVYSDLEGYPVERGRLTAYWHDAEVATYAAADLTAGYWAEKVRQVTRQFVYLRGAAECFVIFDRVESADAAFPKTWFLHLPSEPTLTGSGETCTWLSDAAGDTGLLAAGRSRMVLRSLAPREARITRRGGPGQDFWGNPHNPNAQYNHTLGRDGKEDPAYRRPPFSPWRLEVEPATKQTLDHFLHLLFVTDESSEDAPAAERVEEEDRLGARFQSGERTVTLLFNTTGPPGGRLTVRQGDRVLHDAELAQNLPAD